MNNENESDYVDVSEETISEKNSDLSECLSQANKSSVIFLASFFENFQKFKIRSVLMEGKEVGTALGRGEAIFKTATSVVAAVSTSVIAILGVIGVMAAVVSIGIAIPIAVAAIGLLLGATYYSKNSSRKISKHALRVMESEGSGEALQKIAISFLTVYQYEIKSMTEAQIVKLAKYCFEQLEKNILSKKTQSIKELSSVSIINRMKHNVDKKMKKIKKMKKEQIFDWEAIDKESELMKARILLTSKLSFFNHEAVSEDKKHEYDNKTEPVHHINLSK